MFLGKRGIYPTVEEAAADITSAIQSKSPTVLFLKGQESHLHFSSRFKQDPERDCEWISEHLTLQGKPTFAICSTFDGKLFIQGEEANLSFSVGHLQTAINRAREERTSFYERKAKEYAAIGS